MSEQRLGSQRPAYRDRRITPEMVQRERARIGQVLSRPQPFLETATKDAIRHWAEGIGDRNPLWTDESYAASTPWGTVLAPPSMVLALDRNVVKARGFPGIHGWHLGSTFEWADVIRRDQSFTAETRVDEIREVSSAYAGGTAYDQVLLTELRDRDSGDPSCSVRSVIRRFEREAGRSTRKYGARQKQVYTEEQLEEVDAAYRAERARGGAVLHFEEVQVGDSVPEIVRGPLTVMDCIAFVIGWGGAYVFAHGYAWDFLRAHPGAFPRNESNIPDSPERTHWSDAYAQAIGAPAAFDYGPQRIAWCTTLFTNWMGDAGTLRRLDIHLLRPNYHGDLVRIGAEVTAKDSASRGVELRFWARNQLGEVVSDGDATVELPARPPQARG